MDVRVLLFGSIREAVGAKELEVSLDAGATVSALRALLDARHPVFASAGERLLVAVNQETVEPDRVLADGDEVAFLPPVSGGNGRCTIQDGPLDVDEVVGRVMGPDAGGLVTFVGAVRNHSKGHRIRHLEYEAYPGMAEREMDKIAEQAERRWPKTRLAIAHRVGHLEIGDLAVVIAAVAPHRGEAFAACQFAIDTLKVTVPIWKKEVTTSGEYWVEDHA
ncbi:MAG: molybdopterin converting factor subunit 1 [Myxococcales bacterium]|nr:molybdopterin converting factor subunit 1 [Myxococcales bacterium]